MTAFWACSGAIIADYTHSNAKNNEPSQQSHLLRADGSPGSSIGLVSLTMGGNDVEFPSVMFSCSRIFKCQNIEDPIITGLINHTKPRLAQLYGQILHDAPKAQIFVLGYPHIIASSPSLACQLWGIEPQRGNVVQQKGGPARQCYQHSDFTGR